MWSCQFLKGRRLAARNLPKGRLACTSCAERKGAEQGLVRVCQACVRPISQHLRLILVVPCWQRSALRHGHVVKRCLKLHPRKHVAEAIYFSASNAFSHGAVTIEDLGHAHAGRLVWKGKRLQSPRPRTRQRHECFFLTSWNGR